jgi:hypothetical protein
MTPNNRRGARGGRGGNNMSLANMANMGLIGGNNAMRGLQNINQNRQQPGRANLARLRNLNAYRQGGVTNANRLRRAQAAGNRGNANVTSSLVLVICLANQLEIQAHREAQPEQQ